MLLRTMFLLALIALLAETAVHGASALATAALRTRAVAIAQAQFATAAQSAQSALAESIAEGKDPAHGTMPAPAPTCVLAAADGCALVAQSALAISTPAAEASGTCPDTNCTIYMQANDRVTEGRIAIAISTKVTNPGGTVLASRASMVVFRTFATPPYATLAGSLDGTLADLASGSTGDDGGAAGTLVHVEYVNAVDPSASPIPANVWRPQVQNPAAAAEQWDY